MKRAVQRVGSALTCGAILVSLGVVSTANAALIGRLPATIGGTDYQAYYDDVQDITWLADANLAATNSFGLSYNTNLGDYPGDPYGPSYTEQIQTNGRMTWGAGLHWIDAMNADGVSGYLGYSDWRLPSITDTGTSGCNYSTTGGTDCGWNVDTSTSEMASLWYETLGNLAIYDTSGNSAQPGWGLSNTGPFSNLQSYLYWSGTEYAPQTGFAWFFYTVDGGQDRNGKLGNHYAWAVRSGDVSAVPVPGAMWLFCSGFMALVGFSKRKR